METRHAILVAVAAAAVVVAAVVGINLLSPSSSVMSRASPRPTPAGAGPTEDPFVASFRHAVSEEGVYDFTVMPPW